MLTGRASASALCKEQHTRRVYGVGRSEGKEVGRYVIIETEDPGWVSRTWVKKSSVVGHDETKDATKRPFSSKMTILLGCDERSLCTTKIVQSQRSQWARSNDRDLPSAVGPCNQRAAEQGQEGELEACGVEAC